MEKTREIIDARKLKAILSNKSDFSAWIKRIIQNNELSENKDFYLYNEKIKLSRTKITKRNYFFTIEATRKIILNYKKNKIAQKIKQKLESGENLESILKRIDIEKDAEIKIIKIDNQDYPEQLRKIKKPPRQLYVKGNIKNLKELGIAVIGTRNCSDYGRRMGKVFTKNLVGYNLNIISGLAKGIDTCVHKACIGAKGKTIAVLPSGFNNIFPKENEKLVNKILESEGTVVTEYPPEFEKTSESCRERNRIICGLAIGTLVIEAGEKSGTTKTVKLTNEQNKKAFSIPSSLLSSKGIGTNNMIKEKSAQAVTKVEDIIKEFPELKLERKAGFDFIKIKSKNPEKKKETKSKIDLKIDEENLEIFNFLNEEPKTIDEIVIALNKPINEVTYKLTLLELQGAIEELPGKKFKTK